MEASERTEVRFKISCIKSAALEIKGERGKAGKEERGRRTGGERTGKQDRPGEERKEEKRNDEREKNNTMHTVPKAESVPQKAASEVNACLSLSSIKEKGNDNMRTMPDIQNVPFTASIHSCPTSRCREL